jgi:hypothetical protein
MDRFKKAYKGLKRTAQKAYDLGIPLYIVEKKENTNGIRKYGVRRYNYHNPVNEGSREKNRIYVYTDTIKPRVKKAYTYQEGQTRSKLFGKKKVEIGSTKGGTRKRNRLHKKH